jgi:hypothetical protein
LPTSLAPFAKAKTKRTLRPTSSTSNLPRASCLEN